MRSPLSSLLLLTLVGTLSAQPDTLFPAVGWSAPIQWRGAENREGLLITVGVIQQLYPTVPAVFFERGSAAIPSRYEVKRTVDEADRFADTAIPGGTMEKHRQVLNIIGYRMRRYPKARLTIVGCSSNEPRAGENLQLARSRAEAVRDYLVQFYRIDTSRLMLSARLLPTRPSRSDDPLGREENRRVEFVSNDPHVTDIVAERSYRVFHEPDSVALTVSTDPLDSQIVSRAIEIRRAGTVWHTIALAPSGDTVVGYNWGRGGDPDEWPLDTPSYSVRVLATLQSGARVSSSSTSIPVYRRLAPQWGREPPNLDMGIDEFSLFLFSYDDATTTAAHLPLIREMDTVLRKATDVQIIGHTDLIGDEEYNLALSRSRARAVHRIIAKSASMPLNVALNLDGVGENNPFYMNSLPEGRFYNRTVSVRVVYPDPYRW